MLATLYIYIFF